MECEKDKFVTNIVTNIEDLIQIIEESEETGKHLYFRGESADHDYRTPTLYRQPKLIEKGSEYYYRTLLNELGRDDYGENTSLVRLISELQHYGAVTRMLDVTINPLVALYFALGSNDEDGYLYIYSVETDKEKFDTGHTIAIKSALNLMDQQVIDDFMTACEIIDKQESDKNENKVQNNALRQKTTDEIEALQVLTKGFDKEAIPNFMELLNQRARVRERLIYPFKIYDDLNIAHLVLPSKTTDRIRQQQGAFIFPCYVNITKVRKDIKKVILNINKLEDQEKEKKIKEEVNKKIDKSFQEFILKNEENKPIRIKIERDAKDNLRKQLKLLGITEGYIYPDIEHVSNALLQS